MLYNNDTVDRDGMFFQHKNWDRKVSSRAMVGRWMGFLVGGCMKVRSGLSIFALLVTAMVGGCATGDRGAMDQLSPEHEAAIRRLLDATGAVDIAVKNMQAKLKALAAEDTAVAEVVYDSLDLVDEDYMTEKMVPVYARYFDMENAVAIAKFYERKTGKKYADLAARRDIPSSKYHRYLTYKEKVELERFFASDAGRLMVDVAPDISRDLKELGKEIGDELSLTVR